MKTSLFFILILFAFNLFCQCPDPAFPENDQEFLDELKAKYVERFPNLTFINALGESQDVESLKGEVIVINYWSFSCAPCIKEMPDLNELVRKYKNSAHFFSILSPGKFQIESGSLQAKLKSFDFDYEHVATKECLYENFEIPYIFPTHIIIGKDGKLNDIFFGADIKRLEQSIKSSM